MVMESGDDATDDHLSRKRNKCSSNRNRPDGFDQDY